MRRLAKQAGVDLPLLEKRLSAAFLEQVLGGARGGKHAGVAVGAEVVSSHTVAEASKTFADSIAEMFHSALTQSACTEGAPTLDDVNSAANDNRFALAA